MFLKGILVKTSSQEECKFADSLAQKYGVQTVTVTPTGLRQYNFKNDINALMFSRNMRKKIGVDNSRGIY